MAKNYSIKMLRWVKSQVRLVRQHGVFSRIKSLVKKVRRPLAQSTVAFLCGRPKLRNGLVVMTRKLGIYNTLKSFNFSKNSQSVLEAGSQVNNNSLPITLQNLTPNARCIYGKIKTAIAKYEQENS